ncbi:ATP-binding cassette domain-containing protein [Shewanella baltica]|uniref:ATP-binding cassette domain-containing protein n=1 Tax=Shewanella baltica TaxID=62322 RepID=UPI003D011B6A
MKQFSILFSLLPTEYKFSTILVVLLGCVASALEVIGIASVAPFLQFASTGTMPSFIADYLHFYDKKQMLFNLGAVSCSLIFASFICTQVFMQLTYFLAFKKVALYFSTTIFNKCFEMPVSSSSRLDSSFLVKLISKDANFNIVHAIYVSGIVLVTKVFLLFVVVLGLLFIDPVQALFVFVFFTSLYLLIYLGLRSRLALIGRNISESSNSYMRLIHDAIATIREIYIWDKKTKVKEQFKFLLLSHNGPEFLYNALSQIPKPFVESITFIGIVLSCLYISETGGDVTTFVSRIAVFIIAAYRLIPALQQIFLCFSSAKANSVALSNVVNHLKSFSEDELSEKVLQSKFISMPDSSCLIEFRDVTVFGDSDKIILNKLNLKIFKGEKVAFIGPSGSGKTTCLNTLLGVQGFSSGHFYINSGGFPLTSSWSDSCSLVSQDVYLTDDSLKDNIVFFSDTNVDFERVNTACKVACIDFIEDINSKLGVKGGSLSGGQKQRVGIARALYKPFKLLAMDEATSALDNETEKNLLNNLINFLDEDMSLIMVVHKMDLLHYFDRIIVFSDGEIECDGSLDFVNMNSQVFRRLKVL